MKRSYFPLFRGLLTMGTITAAAIGVATVLATVLRMTGADFQLCLFCLLFSGLSAIGVYVCYYFSHDRKAAHSNGTAVIASRRLSFLMLAVLLTAGIALSVVMPMVGWLGTHSYATVLEVIFTAALGGAAYLSMTHFLPTGVICR